MAAGLEIYNNNGILQITDAFKNIQFLSKQSITLGSTPTKYYYPNYYPYYSLNGLTATAILNNLIACRCENGKLITWDIVYPVIRYPPFVYGTPFIQFCGELGAVITVYFFSYADIPPGDHFEVRNADGELVYSDKGNFMKVIDSGLGNVPADLSLTGAAAPVGTTNHATTTKTAVALGNRSYYTRYNDDGIQGYIRYLMFSFNPTYTLARSTCIYSANSVNYYPNYHPKIYTDWSYQYMVLDVTGL